MIAKKINPAASEGNILALTEGANLCCGDADRMHYEATIATDTHGTVSAVNITAEATISTVTLTGAPIDWSDSENDEELILALGKVATDKGYEWLGGGIELERDGNNLTVKIKDSTLVFNWIGTASTNEAAMTASSPY